MPSIKAHISAIINRVAPFIGLRGSLAADPTARILHVLLAALFVWMAAGWVASTPFAQVKFSFPRMFYLLVLEASYVTALVLLRLGNFKRASLAYLAGTWIWATLVSFSFGGIHSPGALLYVSLPASAAWLLGYKGAIRTAGWCLLSTLVFTVLELTHVSLPLQATATALGIWFVLVQAVLINAIPVGQIIGRLRESQRRLVSIYNTVADVIFYLVVEPEGQFRFVSVNLAFLKVTGLSQESVIGKTVNEVVPEPSLAMILGKYRQAIEEKTVVNWEETSDFPTGRLTGQVSVAPVFDNTGTCTHLVGSVHDITEGKRAELALRESEERFRLMADTAPVMIVTADEHMRATFFNKVWLDFTGRTMEQELDKGWSANVHPSDRKICLEGLTASYTVRRECRLEYRLRRADGEYRFMLCNGVPRYERDGVFAGYIASIVDVTELKRSQRILEEYRGRLQELTAGLLNAQETVSRELARELHDVFSQELVAVRMKIFKLRQGAGCGPELGQQLLELGNTVARLATDIHRASHKLHSGILDELGLVPALAHECEAFQEQSGILTHFVVEEMPTALPKDVSMCLYRVTEECLRNIGKHGVNTNEVQVSLTAVSERIVLTVENDGRGFDLKESRQRGGLGLISIEERIRLVNGSLSIRSQPDEGTVVEVIVSIESQAQGDAP